MRLPTWSFVMSIKQRANPEFNRGVIASLTGILTRRHSALFSTQLMDGLMFYKVSADQLSSVDDFLQKIFTRILCLGIHVATTIQELRMYIDVSGCIWALSEKEMTLELQLKIRHRSNVTLATLAWEYSSNTVGNKMFLCHAFQLIIEINMSMV